jgi:hypothetical protein
VKEEVGHKKAAKVEGNSTQAQITKVTMMNNGKLVACPGKDSGESYDRAGQWTPTPAFTVSRRNDSLEYSPPSMRKIHQSAVDSNTTYFEFSTDLLPVAPDLSYVPKDGFFLATPSEIEAERSAGQRSKQQDLKSEKAATTESSSGRLMLDLLQTDKNFINLSGAGDPAQTGFVPIRDDRDNRHLPFRGPTRFHLKPKKSGDHHHPRFRGPTGLDFKQRKSADDHDNHHIRFLGPTRLDLKPNKYTTSAA